MSEAIFYIGIGFIIGAALSAVVFLSRQAALSAKVKAHEDAHAALEDRFKVTAQEAVKNAHESFLQLAQEKFQAVQKDHAHEVEKKNKAIADLVDPVHKNLQALGQAVEQVKGTDKALREDLQSLSRETAKLVGALRDPSAQGQWGEFILEGILDKSGLIKGVHYETQVSVESDKGRQQPDAVINMQDGFSIVVDAKAPINEFTQRLSEDLTEDDTRALMQNLARQVRGHVKQLGRKNYWENIESADFTVMFLPSEHIYSMALRADPDLVDYASGQAVIIASPTLLMSLLRVVSLSWRQVELAKNAQEISERGIDLYKRLLTFTGHLEKVGKNIGTALRGYNDAVGSLERSVLPAARKFKDLQGVSSADSLPETKILEDSPRALTLSAEDENERKRA